MSKKSKKTKKANNTKKRVTKGINWIVHYVTDSICDMCGDNNTPHFKPNLCNAHTHGLRELYGHPEFQFVLNIGMKTVLPILNHLGLMVKSGRRFKAGDSVSGIILGYDIRLFEATDNGKKVLRVVVPDQYNRFPDDEDCEAVYNLQHLSTKNLMVD